MDGGNLQFRKVAFISGLLRGGRDAVSQFEGCLLGERTHDQLAGFGEFTEENVHGPQD
jgi:hypothetical protein